GRDPRRADGSRGRHLPKAGEPSGTRRALVARAMRRIPLPDTAGIITPMKPKIPWVPSEVHPGQKTERCPRCGANKLIPWTLRRDRQRVIVLRTWVCTACQTMEERPEPE